MSTIAAIETQADLLIQGAPPPNDHFLHPKQLPIQNFELHYEERRHHSHDPRIRKQISDEVQFDSTICRGIWTQHLAKYASTLKERWMNAVEFETLLLSVGVTNPRLRGKVTEAFDVNPPERKWNAVVVCKQMEMLLTNPQTQDDFIAACFDRFDRPDPARKTITKQTLLLAQLSPIDEEPITFRWRDEISAPTSAKKFSKVENMSTNKKVQNQMKEFLEQKAKMQAQQSTFVLPDIEVKKKHRRRKKKAPPYPFQMRSGATHEQLEPLKTLIMSGDCGNEYLDYINFEDFKKVFLDPENAEWVATFLGTIMESIATFCQPPLGAVPPPPLIWMQQTLEVIAPAKMMADADILLLTQLERAGGSLTDPVPKKKRKLKSTSRSGSADSKRNSSARSVNSRNASVVSTASAFTAPNFMGSSQTDPNSLSSDGSGVSQQQQAKRESTASSTFLTSPMSPSGVDSGNIVATSTFESVVPDDNNAAKNQAPKPDASRKSLVSFV